MKVPNFLLGNTVSVEDSLGVTSFGPKFAAARTVRCRVEYRKRLIKTAEGADIISEASVITSPDESLPLGARVTIDGRKMHVVDIRKPEGLNGKAVQNEVLVAP